VLTSVVEWRSQLTESLFCSRSKVQIMKQERVNRIESFMYRKLCFYGIEEKLIKCVILESGGFCVVRPRSIQDGKYCFIIPLRFVEYKM